MQKYTSTMTEAFYNIKNAGVISGANVACKSENKNNGEVVKIYMDIKSKKVEKISFLTSGSIVLCISLDALCSKISGRPVNEIESLSERDVIESLQQLNKKDLAEATFAVESIKKAYTLYCKKQAKGTLQQKESKTRAINPTVNVSVYKKQTVEVETTIQETVVETKEVVVTYDQAEVVTTENIDQLTKTEEASQSQTDKKPASKTEKKKERKFLFFKKSEKKKDKKTTKQKAEKVEEEKPVKTVVIPEGTQTNAVIIPERPQTQKVVTIDTQTEVVTTSAEGEEKSVVTSEPQTEIVVLPQEEVAVEVSKEPETKAVEEAQQPQAVVEATKTTTTTTVTKTKKSSKKAESVESTQDEEAEVMVKSVGKKRQKPAKKEQVEEQKNNEPQSVSEKLTQDNSEVVADQTTNQTQAVEYDEIDAITENLTNAISQLNFKFDDDETSKKSKKK